MSSWPIHCSNGECGHVIETANIAELVNPENGYLDGQSQVVCEKCGGRGYPKPPASRPVFRVVGPQRQLLPRS